MAECKSCNFENICTMPDFVRNNIKDCKVYEPKKKQTNADRIRAMSDAELAEFLRQTVEESGANLFDCEGYACTSCAECKAYLKWLQSEAEEQHE